MQPTSRNKKGISKIKLSATALNQPTPAAKISIKAKTTKMKIPMKKIVQYSILTRARMIRDLFSGFTSVSLNGF